jgi:hypothetical protein
MHASVSNDDSVSNAADSVSNDSIDARQRLDSVSAAEMRLDTFCKDLGTAFCISLL